MSLVRYRLYNGANRYKLRSPSFNGKGSFVLGVALTVTEDTSAHQDVTCFDGGDGSITVQAIDGLAPYLYSIDGTNWQSSPTFANLAITGPVTEGTDEYGGIVICTKTIYVKDANNHIGSINVQLKSPVELEWLNAPSNMTVFCDPGQNYATIDVASMAAVPSTRANNYYQDISGISPNNQYQKNQTYTITFEAENDCGEYIEHQFTITVLPLYYPNAIQDYDGNWYDAVVIGDQVWTARSLRTTHYSDGTAIPAGGNNASDTDPYYYGDSSSDIPLNLSCYLYNWPAVMNGASSSNTNPSGVKGIAPTGWHVPSGTEWAQLTGYVNNQSVYRYNNVNGSIAKALAYTDYWDTNNTPGNVGNDQSSNNATLFGAVPNYSYTNVIGYFWTTNQTTNEFGSYATCYEIYSWVRDVPHSGRRISGKHQIRCVCDLSPMDFVTWYYNQYGSYNHQLPTE